MMRFVLILLPFLLVAAPAQAAVIGAAISAIAGAFAGAGALALTVGRLVLSVAIAAYQKRRMQKKLAQRQSGITTQFVGTGGTTPLTVIVGRYATNGHLEAPQMSHDGNGKPNAWLTYVIGLGDLPGIVPTGRLVINDKWYNITNAENPNWPGYGFAVDGDVGGNALIRFRTGRETTADAWLLATYGSAPERPWLADMVGRGVPQAIINLWRNPTLFPGEPRLRFEVWGIPLYDPRRDSTVGGAGTQRWSDRTTWVATDNPKVIEYNIQRGITVDGFGIWGNRVRAEDLPLSNWFAAMNACDLLVDNGMGGTEKAYVFGFEWSLDTEPRQIIDEINRSCGGETVEVGGVWKTRVGGVGLPVYFITDGDIIVTRPQELDPFPGLDGTFNALSCSFPDPDILWEAREAPPLTNALWEAEDGSLEYDEALNAWVRQPRRLLREVSLPAVSNHRQVQRLISAMAREGRKRISHVLTLTPAALALEPLDAVAWTSQRNGYVGKVFDVVLTADPVTTLRPRIGLLEADPADYTPPAYVPLQVPSSGNPVWATRSVIGFAVAPYTLTDGTGTARRPGLQMTWDGVAMAQVDGIAWEVRVAATQAIAAQGSAQRAADGGIVLGGFLSATAYQVRARVISDGPSEWTLWLGVVTPDVRLTSDEFDAAVQAALAEAEAARGLIADALDEARGYTDATLSAEIPRLINTEAALDQLATQVSWLVAAGARTDMRLADAGLYIDPDTGRARLEAVSRIDGQLTQVGVTLDGIAGQLALRVTQADLDLAIAAAQLDPEDLPVIGALNGRVTDLELSLDAAEAAIEQRATLVDFDDLSTTVTGASTRLDALEAQIVQTVSEATFTLLEERVSTAEVVLSAFDGAGLVIEVSDLRQQVEAQSEIADATLANFAQSHAEQMARLADAAFVRQEYHALVDDERVARASLRTELGAAIEANLAQILQEQTARSDADGALATQIGVVSATAQGRNRTFRQGTAPAGPVVGDVWYDTSANNRARRWSGTAWVDTDDTRIATNQAAIEEEAIARADGDSALANQITTVAATVANNQGAIEAEAIARADGDSALAGQLTTISANVGDLAAEIEEESIARADADTALAGQISTVSANVGDLSAEVEQEAIARADGDSALASQITAVSATAESRNRTFRQSSAPSGPVTGDVWYDTSANNRPRRWSGSAWVDTQDTRIASNTAAITEEAIARADGDSALANQITTVAASVGDLSAEVTTQATALADVEGNLAASLVLRARAGGAAGEIEVVAADDPTGSPVSSVVIRSDRFRFEGDLAEFLGTVRIDGDLVVTGSIERPAIAPGAFTSFDLIQNPVTFNGMTPSGVDTLIGTQSVVFSSTPNLVPERIVARPRFSGFAPAEGAGSGSTNTAALCYYRIVLKRDRAGTIVTLRDYIEPYSQAEKTGDRLRRVFYAGRPPSAVIMVSQPSFLPGDTLIFEYYWHRWWNGNWQFAVTIDSYDLELERYFR